MDDDDEELGSMSKSTINRSKTMGAMAAND